MNKLLSLFLVITFLYSCSTSSKKGGSAKKNSNKTPTILKEEHYKIPENTVLEYFESLKRYALGKNDIKAVLQKIERHHEETMALIKEIETIERQLIDQSGGHYFYEAETKGILTGRGFEKFSETTEKALDGVMVAPAQKSSLKEGFVLSGQSASLRKKTKALFANLEKTLLSSEMRSVNFRVEDVKRLKRQINNLLGIVAEDAEDPWVASIWKDKELKEGLQLFAHQKQSLHLANIALLQYLKEVIQDRNTLIYDTFDVFSNSSRPYVVLGETFEADIYLGAFTSQARFSASVNGASLMVEDGKAKYRARPSKVGMESYTAIISISNPLTGEIKKIAKDFQYEVILPSAIITADKMNVFYVGVDNPISAMVAGVSHNDIKISITGGDASLQSRGDGRYIVKCNKMTMVNITLSHKETGKKLGVYPFRVKRIPDPVATLGNGKKGGVIKAAEMHEMRGLIAMLENFDFDARCRIQGFTMYYTPKRQDPIEIVANGGQFTGRAIQAIQSAKFGDSYQFIDVKGRCPGDQASRKLNSLAFIIK